MHRTAHDVLAGRALWSAEQGDCLRWLPSLPDDCVDLLCCSPPYEDARTYADADGDHAIARKADDWVAWMLDVCEAARRVCKGLCAFVVEGKTDDFRYSCSPYLLIADLHRRGFFVRRPCVFLRYGIAGSGGTDWLRNDHEPVVCFTRPGKLPWVDQTACGHPPRFGPGGEMSHRTADGARVNGRNEWGMQGGSGMRRASGKRRTHGVKTGATRGYKDGDTLNEGVYVPPVLANPGNVISCKVGGGNMGSKLCHENEAPFPESLAEFFVLTFCPPGGVVCDPFSGSGTTAAVSLRHGRRAVACDLRRSQVELSRKRIGAETPSLFAQEG
jgi:hypothetical protein